MLSNFGNSLIIINIILALVIIYRAYLDSRNQKKLISKNIYKLSLLQSTLTIICFFTLLSAFIISDFSITTVFQNSHTSKPLFYKIAGAWGNHEGSLLLWINIMVIFSFLFLIFNKNSKKQYNLYTLITQNILILGFFVFMLVNSNPFLKIFPVPANGLGLNPILQDPALAIHPPLLYLGFVGSSIYFSAAMGSLLSNYQGKSFGISIKPWVLLSWSFQTLGIILGSIWAYYELGWGGFWFWDPVENSSLLPWFAMTALLHSIMILEKKNILYSWVIILCLSTFILSVTGTFLVRSGILNSVHTFANDPSRGLYILIFLTFMIFSAFIVFFKKIKTTNQITYARNRETFILTNNYFMIFYLMTVFIGTVYPIFTEVLYQTKISVGPPFYNIVIIPIVVPFLFLMSIGAQSSWTSYRLDNFKSIIIILLLAILINIFISYFFKSYNVLSNLIFISSLFLIISTIKDFYKLKNKNSFSGLSRIVSHLGFGLLVFFIGINHNFSVEKNFNLQVGQSEKFGDYKVDFKKLTTKKKENHLAIVGNFQITNIRKNSEKRLKPEIRIYKNPETITYEASINSNFFEDYYLTMSNVSRSDFYNIKFQNKPFMMWVWISAFMISIGGFLRLFEKNEK